MEQVLYQLPDGWEWKSLGDLVEFKNGYAFKSNVFSDSGIPVLRISNIQSGGISDRNMAYIQSEKLDVKAADFYVEPGDIVIAMSGATTGKVATNNTEDRLLQNQRVGRFIITDKTFRKYVLYYLENKVEENLQKSLGAAQPNLSTAQIKEIKIPIQPANEQKRIVEKLDALLTRIDTVIEHLQESVTLANTLYKSCVNQTFNPLNSIKNPDNSYLIPKNWQWISLGEFVDFRNGYAFKSSNFSDMGVPVLRISNIQDGSVSTKNMVYISENKLDKNALQFFIEPGDIVIAMSGATTGKVAINNTDLRYLQNQRVGRFIVSDSHLKKYIFYYLESKMEENLNKSLGAAQPNLSTAQIKEIMIPTQPKETQVEIVNKLDGFSKTNKMITLVLHEKISELTTLKTSILDSAFKGEL